MHFWIHFSGDMNFHAKILCATVYISNLHSFWITLVQTGFFQEYGNPLLHNLVVSKRGKQIFPTVKKSHDPFRKPGEKSRDPFVKLTEKSLDPVVKLVEKKS